MTTESNLRVEDLTVQLDELGKAVAGLGLRSMRRVTLNCARMDRIRQIKVIFK